MSSLNDVKHAKLASGGFTGSVQDMEYAWLVNGGYGPASIQDMWHEGLDAAGIPTGNINDRLYYYFKFLGYTGSLQGMWYQFWDGYSFGPPTDLASLWYDDTTMVYPGGDGTAPTGWTNKGTLGATYDINPSGLTDKTIRVAAGINGLPSIECEYADSQIKSLLEFVPAVATWSFFIVFKPIDGATTNDLINSFTAGGYNCNYLHLAGVVSQLQIAFNLTVPYTPISDMLQPQILMVQSQISENLRAIVDTAGTFHSDNTVPSSDTNIKSTSILGSCDALVSEFQLYDFLLSSSQVSAGMNYLKTKWGI